MLIKVEAINIYAYVDDADNLSAIRGGGLMLLDMPARFGDWLKGLGDVKKLTEGASKGVFRFSPREKETDVKRLAREWLTKEYPHATIGLAVLEKESGSFFADEDALTTGIRSQQMRSFSVTGLTAVEGGSVCTLDRVRPGTERRSVKGTNELLSHSCAERFDYGLEQKRRFLHSRAGIDGEWQYTRHMDELSDREEGHALRHKIAIFYADGNAFAKKLRQALDKEPPEKQEQVIRDFDIHLQAKRREFLAALLESTGKPEWKAGKEARRVEVLLWGGDEMMVVVPAWCGWKTAELFCGVMTGADFNSRGVPVPLKHGMGLIFAHHKAPIHALRGLVGDLAEESKNERWKGRDRNRLSYLVLESFDHIGESLEQFRASRHQAGIDMALCAEGEALARLWQSLETMKDKEFPRRKVHQAALGLARGTGWEELRKDIEPFLDRECWRQPWEQWKQLAGDGAAGWFHLAELWDYVGLE